jgi:hypothetical protein
MRVRFVARTVSSMWMASTTRSMRIPPTAHTRIALHGTGPDVRLLPGEPLSIVWRWRRAESAAAHPEDLRRTVSLKIAYEQTDG